MQGKPTRHTKIGKKIIIVIVIILNEKDHTH